MKHLAIAIMASTLFVCVLMADIHLPEELADEWSAQATLIFVVLVFAWWGADDD